MSATIFWCDDWESRQWRFSITAMCRDGVALRFDVLRNSYNTCDAAAMGKSCAYEAQRILKAVESRIEQLKYKDCGYLSAADPS